MIYLDNSATSIKKPLCVKLAVLKSLFFYTANPGRSGHKLSQRTAMQIYKTRKTIKEFFNAPNVVDVIFTGSCTEALNLALIGTAQKNKHIVITVFEHNSVLRTINHLSKTHNITYNVVLPNKNGKITAKEIESAINENTYLIAVNHTSNVTGATCDISSIGKLAKEKNLIFLVDGAQSAGHEKIDVQKQNINLLALAGHKGLLGLQGVGVLITNNVNIKPIKFGGTGTKSENPTQPNDKPEGFESGTLPTPNIIALNYGVKYVNKNFNKINKKITNLTTYLLNELKQIKEINLYSNNEKSGVVSFEIKNLDCNFVVNELNEKYKICTRGGLHCAPLIHKHLHHNTGLVRVSIGHNNKKWHITKLIKALKSIILNTK